MVIFTISARNVDLMRPKEYTYEHLPPGTRICIPSEDNWLTTNHVARPGQKGTIYRLAVLEDMGVPIPDWVNDDIYAVDGPRVTVLFDEPYQSEDAQFKVDYVDAGWPCEILAYVYNCIDCKQDFEALEIHYLCPSCRTLQYASS